MITHTVPLFWGYTISDDGVVKYEGADRLMGTYNIPPYVVTPFISKGDYPRVNLVNPRDGSRHKFLVHRLVAHAFCVNPRPDIFNQVDHIDGNPRYNNNKSNLRWVNRELNMINLTKAKNAYYSKRYKKWQAKVRGVKLGWFHTMEEAIARSRLYREELFTKRYAELTCNA